MLGFGPSAISFSSADDFRSAWKTLNPTSATDYAASVRRSGHVFGRYFHYEDQDLRIFYLTRRLAALRIDRNAYRGVFGSDPAHDFEREFAALESERLVTADPFGIEPTPRGMFFADSIAALLCWRRLRAYRANGSRRATIEVRRAERPRSARKDERDMTQQEGWQTVDDEDPNDNGFGHM
jgi:oxygen-independent coproporphyrinogen-3 oxidase